MTQRYHIVGIPCVGSLVAESSLTAAGQDSDIRFPTAKEMQRVYFHPPNCSPRYLLWVALMATPPASCWRTGALTKRLRIWLGSYVKMRHSGGEMI